VQQQRQRQQWRRGHDMISGGWGWGSGHNFHRAFSTNKNKFRNSEQLKHFLDILKLGTGTGSSSYIQQISIFDAKYRNYDAVFSRIRRNKQFDV
jgi:hypothetical protein